mgnify:FL=1
MIKSKTYTLPANYKLGSIAEKVADDLGLELQEDYTPLWKAMTTFANVPGNLLHFVIGQQGKAKEPLMLLGERDKSLIHYSGAMSEEGNVCESLYVNDLKRIIGVTFGIPEGRGALTVLDIAGSIALQELSGVYAGGMVYDLRLPKPEPFRGAAQFEDFSRVYKTINTLLK